MIETWKVPHMIKGMLTWIPAVDNWRLRRVRASASDSPRYCYAVWFRHLVTLKAYGFTVANANVGELGPGESLGVGLAAILSGARSYTGLDVTPFAQKTALDHIFNDLVQMFTRQEPIPNEQEFPFLLPKLKDYVFPDSLVHCSDVTEHLVEIQNELAKGPNHGQFVNYHAPWNSLDDVSGESLELILSQAVLEHVDDLETTYKAMFKWLKPGGYASHVIDFGCHHLAPVWNGHWVYTDWQWRIVKGHRKILLNRAPLSTHLAYAKKVGFQLLGVNPEYDNGGFNCSTLSQRRSPIDAEDARTRAAMLILRKP